MFEKIKKWYQMKLWTESMVIQAFNKGVITEDQLFEIIPNVEGGEVNG